MLASIVKSNAGVGPSLKNTEQEDPSRNNKTMNETNMTNFDAPDVATFEMVGLKEHVTMDKNNKNNWSIERDDLTH